MNVKLRKVVAEETEQIVALTNRAFAVERFFKAGDRTDLAQVRGTLFLTPRFLYTGLR
jgi:hypothetical protein